MKHLPSLYAAAVQIDTVDAAARRVSGYVLPYGEVGLTSVGPVICPGPGRIAIPEALQRVKLVDEHQDPPRSVGYLAAARDTAEGLRAEFNISRTPLGDMVLAEMTPDENGHAARDGFSVELADLTLDDGVPAPILVSASLSAVAAVVTPAFTSARADGLAAARPSTTTPTDEEGTTMTDEQRERLAALRAQHTLTQEEAAELATLAALEEEPGDEDPDEDEEEATGAPAPQSAAASRPRPVRVPTGTGTQPRSRGRFTIADLSAAQARVLSGVSKPQLEAALSNITSTANIWTARDDYAGELWSGLEYQRQYVGDLQPGPLPSYKGTGWRWVVKPAVADYAGDKTAVPSNAPTTEATEWEAARLAGAHDLDRKFFDFGDQEFIASYYRALTEDYAIKSDAKARAWIIANAVAAGAAGLTIWHAAAKASQAVFDATGGRSPDYLYVNSADTFDLLNTTAADAPNPAILEMFGVTPDKFKQVPGVAAGTVIAGIRQAGRFRELANSPIRVEALDIANGGVDGGVFGYYAIEETFVGGIQSATFDATP